ncbi:MAG: phytoene desaturase [Desulfobulbaceae bacterium]|nr:phytoene desaturase [Candidatus Kapabacteria bacterium]MBS3999980.1 phytoene desaturase [Desulfobulbaceae bacterium]
MKKIAIVGAGLGGLSTAIRLAKSGFDVDIFEQNNEVGGKVSEILMGDYRFDTGPSVITLIDVINELFELAGADLSEQLDFIKIDPISRNIFYDGQHFDLYSNVDLLKSEYTRFTGIDPDQINKYILKITNIYKLTADIFLHQPLHEYKKLIKEKKFPPLSDFLFIDAFRTMHDANKSYFIDEHIVQVFDRYATYNGSSPYLIPATLNIIAYVELILGSYYIKGGIHQLVKAIHGLARKVGVKIFLNTKVDEILHDGNQIKGIRIGKDTSYYDYVVANSDVVETFRTLLSGFPAMTKKMEKIEPSLSGMVFMWGINKTHENLLHHNVFYSKDYKNEFVEIFDSKIMPTDPTIYLAITSKTEKNHAPLLSENWFILINMPYINENLKKEEFDLMRQRVLNKLKEFGYDIESNIEYESIITPYDLQNRYGANKGSIYGISSNSKFTAFKRHPNRSKLLKNLFFAGGSVHPGGGVPLVILSGKHVADLIISTESLNK